MTCPPGLTIVACLFITLVIPIGRATSLRPQEQELRSEQGSQQVADVKPVVMTVTVTNDRGEFVSGLKQDRFSVLDEKAPQKLTYFNDQDIPIDVGILFDVSASMWRRDAVKIIRDALGRFVQLSNSSNRYLLISFNQKPQVLQDWTTDSATLLDKLNLVQLKGQTAFYDACYLALDKLSQSRSLKQALLLISDGLNTESHYTSGQVKRSLKESNVMIYSINLLADDKGAGSSLGFEGQNTLNELSLISGGMTFYRQDGARLAPKQINSVFETIAEELRHQYLIGFHPATDKKWHKVKIKLLPEAGAPRVRSHLTLRTRQGYFANRHPL